jgi:prepilin-type N-terminal cleavage/methylation domain-containing protein
MAFLIFFRSSRAVRSLLIGQGKGFSLIEVLVVVIILGILSALAIPLYNQSIKDHKLTKYGNNLEYLIKSAKIMAMERTTNIGICVDSNTKLTVYNMGTSRGGGACSGTEVMSMTIESGDATGHSISLSGTGGSFDPRGLAIFTGSACVSSGIKYYKVFISRTGLRTENKTGACP